MNRLNTIYFAFFLALAASRPINAQDSDTSALYIALKEADSLVFAEGFNQCRLDILQNVMHSDLQFLHDLSGAQNRAEFFKIFEESICSNPGAKPIRKLKEGSLTVYPLNNQGNLYGAVQMGIHEFYLLEPGKELRYTGSGRFIHTWLFEERKWKLFRVISYDHKQAKM